LNYEGFVFLITVISNGTDAYFIKIDYLQSNVC